MGDILTGPSSSYLHFLPAVQQNFVQEASNAYVIVGNAALFKCEIPSFVSDMVRVVSWEDNEGTSYHSVGQDFGISSSSQI